MTARCAPPRRGLRQVSEKRQRRESTLRDTKSRLLDERRTCEVLPLIVQALNTMHLDDGEVMRLSEALNSGCRGPLDLHHIQQRALGGTDEDSNLQLACRLHHSWTHDHVALSHRIGTLRTSWDGRVV